MVPSIDYQHASDAQLSQLAAHSCVEFVRAAAQRELDARSSKLARLARDVRWLAGWIVWFVAVSRAFRFAQVLRAAASRREVSPHEARR